MNTGNTLSILLLGLVLWACGGSSSSTENNSDTTVISLPKDSASVASDTTDLAESEITWLSDSYDFGEIEEGTIVSHEFSFVNTGKNPLIISSASPSCGCTVPDWPKEPIAVGDTAKIAAKFNSQGRTGIQNKRINITANTRPSLSTLTIRGEVKAKK